MAQVIIQNPIINRPFAEPSRHFRFNDQGITDEIIDSRRESEYFIPVAKPRKKGAAQLALGDGWTEERREPNELVNRIRVRINAWRQGGYAGTTPTTRKLLQYWTDPERERKFFFCQIEALETAIYLTECAHRFGDNWIANTLGNATDLYNPGLSRIAHKMATGSGKTVVMAMLIAWQTLNKIESPQDTRFTDTFLVVTPGITIRDRLQVLQPNNPDNYYRARDIVGTYDLERLNRANIVITNFHAFQLREKGDASKTTKQILGADKTGAFTETPAQMVNRVLGNLRSKKSIVVLNDEAHHCYRRKQETSGTTEPASQPGLEKLTLEEKAEVRVREEEARIWISGLEAIEAKIGIKRVFDLSATPFFLKGSGEPEGTLFPWVVSDFSLIDAIESGIVKIPRVPVSDNQMYGDLPANREVWLRIRDDLPKKGAKTERVVDQPALPGPLEAALQTLYGDYEKSFTEWENADKLNGQPPPVFIVVCNNTNVSRMVYHYIGGWEKPVDTDKAVETGRETMVQAGKLEAFRNDDGNGNWLRRPNTILVDSAQLETGGAMSPEFKAAAATEIDEFKSQYRIQYGRNPDDLTDADLLREVMNTVGKAGKLGGQVRCVVSVSMLTEGWDANTVTHILGVRAFGTQLLCEQVVGRALRRTSYATDDNGFFAPEYADVFGVPFSFIPTTGETKKITRKAPTRVRALDDRIDCEITFPRVTGYRYQIRDRRLEATFDESSKLVLSPEEIATWTENQGVIGETNILDLLAKYGNMRTTEIAYQLASRLVTRHLVDKSPDGEQPKPWLFPDALRIAKVWMGECLHCKDETVPGMVLLEEYTARATNKMYAAIVRADETTSDEPPRLMPILRAYDTLGSTRYVDFDTTKPVYVTDPAKCHISHVVGDTETWEQKMAQVLEQHPAVVKYVKNQGLGFTIPYTVIDDERQYVPDFIACLDDGSDQLLNLIVEVSGEFRKDKVAKAETARDFWVPAINNYRQYGRWAYINITDPWEAKGFLDTYADGEVP